MHVSYGGIKSLLRDGVVATGANLGCQAVVQDQLADKLCQDGGPESKVGQLERVAEDIKVASGQDKGDDGGIGNGRST